MDHFVPWSRYPDDGLDNFVVADKRCNGDKSSSLAAGEHLSKWVVRVKDGSPLASQLDDVARGAGWETADVQDAQRCQGDLSSPSG